MAFIGEPCPTNKTGIFDIVHHSLYQLFIYFNLLLLIPLYYFTHVLTILILSPLIWKGINAGFMPFCFAYSTSILPKFKNCSSKILFIVLLSSSVSLVQRVLGKSRFQNRHKPHLATVFPMRISVYCISKGKTGRTINFKSLILRYRYQFFDINALQGITCIKSVQ